MMLHTLKLNLPPRPPIASVEIILLGYQLLMALIHQHYLHAFIYPRFSTFILFILQILLCTRHLLLVEILRLFPFQKGTWFASWLVAVPFIFLISSRPLATGMPRAWLSCWWMLLGSTLLELVEETSGFAEKLLSILFSSVEAAYIVGVLPAIHSYNESILSESREHMRIAAQVFLNTLVISLIHLLPAIRRGSRGESGDAAAATVVTASSRGGTGGSYVLLDAISGSFLWLDGRSPPKTALVFWGGSQPEYRLRLGVNRIELPAESEELAYELSRANCTPPSREMWSRLAPRGGPPPKIAPREWRLLPAFARDLQALYLKNADFTHLCLIGVQSACVVGTLAQFLYTHHWRSHMLSLAVNYAILYACLRLRRQQLNVRSRAS